MATTTTAIPRKYVQIRDAENYTGLGPHTLREKVATGELPAYRATDKPGAAYLFKLSDLDALMKPVIPEGYFGQPVTRGTEKTRPARDLGGVAGGLTTEN